MVPQFSFQFSIHAGRRALRFSLQSTLPHAAGSATPAPTGPGISATVLYRAGPALASTMGTPCDGQLADARAMRSAPGAWAFMSAPYWMATASSVSW